MIEAPILAATVAAAGIPPAATIEDPKRLALAWASCRVACAPSGIFFSLQLTLIARWDRGAESPHQGRPGEISPHLRRMYRPLLSLAMREPPCATLCVLRATSNAPHRG